MKYLFFISCFLLSMPTLEGVNSHQPPSIISSSKARNNKSTPIKQKSAKKNIRPFKLVKWIFLGGKKQRNKKAFNANDISFISGITSVVSVLVLFGISNLFFYLFLS